MGIVLGSSFDRTSAVPLDSIATTATLVTRDAIAAGVRFLGMFVFCVADGKTYILKSGITNSDWVEFGAGAAIVTTKDVFNGTGSQTAFTLSFAPGSIANVFVYISGVYQLTSGYSLAGTTLTFSTAPPTGTGNIEVVYGSALAIGTPGDGTVTQAKKAIRVVVDDPTAGTAGQIVRSTSCGFFNTTSNTYVDVTNLTVTITTLGNPVKIEFINDGTSNQSFFSIGKSGTSAYCFFKILRGATSLGEIKLGVIADPGPTTAEILYGPNSISVLDHSVSAGTYTYKLQALSTTSGANVAARYLKMIAYEI